MVTQVNVIMKAQKNLLIIFQVFIVFRFFLDFFSHSGGFFDVIRKQKGFCFFFFPKIKVFLHTLCVRAGRTGDQIQGKCQAGGLFPAFWSLWILGCFL